MKIRKSKYHQKSVKVAHCGALIWRKFPTNCDAHLAERFLKGRENNHLLKSLFKLSVIFMTFTASGCTLAVPDAGTDGNLSLIHICFYNWELWCSQLFHQNFCCISILQSKE